jgi:hypothetical protein
VSGSEQTLDDAAAHHAETDEAETGHVRPPENESTIVGGPGTDDASALA